MSCKGLLCKQLKIEKTEKNFTKDVKRKKEKKLNIE
jgi:hypothetical protein